MKLTRITDWLDRTLKVDAFDDVSNNGLQIDRGEATGTVSRVAFAVDASERAVKAAAAAGAELLVVHHGISWGGGIRRIQGGVGAVVRAAIKSDLALYACHLPLDAHPVLGNNAQLADLFGLAGITPAFSYHGNVIGCVGHASAARVARGLERFRTPCGGFALPAKCAARKRLTVGVCSGGAAEFAEDAKNLGCDLYLTGEANWGEVVAAENCGMPIVCLGHYATEVWGVRAVARSMKRTLRVETLDLTDALA